MMYRAHYTVKEIKKVECVGYLRVSTEKQAEEGNGIESQKRDIENYAKKNEMIVTDWYIDDGYTGANMDRPQLQRLINDAMSKRIKCVVAFKLDRISRSMVDGIYIIEKIFIPNGVEFKCVHDSVNYDSPMEQAYTQMMAVFAQLDKNTMMLRMRGGMLERVKKGYWWGGGNLPYAYTYNKEKGILEPIPERAEQARNALDLFLQGYSDEKIKYMLGFTHEHTVMKLLTSVINIGMIPYKGQVYQGLHEPILDKDKFNLGLDLRKSRRKVRYVPDPKLLTGLCVCGVCGCKMRYQKWSGNIYRIYCCSRNSSLTYLPNYNKDCDNDIFYADDIEKQVTAEILKISVNVTRSQISEKKSKLDILTSQLERERQKVKRLYVLYSEGNDDVVELIKEREREIESIKDHIKREQKEQANEPNKDLVFENIKKVADIWDHVSNAERNKILKSIINKIIIVNGEVDIILKNF